MRPLLLTLAALAAVAPAGAHDLTARLEIEAGMVVLRAAYDGVDPAAQADVEVYRPDEPAKPFQSGRSDRNGVFVFLPDAPGAWRVVVDDGFGHRVERTIEAGAESAAIPSDAPPPGRWRDALTGVSLLIGLTGLWLWRRSRA